MHKIEKGYFGTKWMSLTNQPAMGFAWMVTALMVASTPFRGRWFFGFTGIRSSSSKVSQPSITFPNTVYLEQDKIWSRVPAAWTKLLTWDQWRAEGHMWGTTDCRWCWVQSWPLRELLWSCASSHPWSHPGVRIFVTTGLLQNKGAPEISLPKCSRPLFQYLLGLQSVPWSPGKSKNVNIANSCLCINSLSSSPWCFVWTCNCCSSLFHTRPGNFHKSDEKYFRYFRILIKVDFTKIFCKPLRVNITNHLVPWGTAHKRAPFWCLPHSCEPWQTC